MMEVAALLAATALAMALVPTAKRGNSKTPAGPFHTMVRAVETTSSMAAIDLGPMSSPCQSAGKSFDGIPRLGLGVGGEVVGENVVDGQQQVDALGLRLFERCLGHVDLVFFDQRLAGGDAQCALEGVSHAADDDERVDLVEQVVDDVDLAGDLGAADDGHEGLLGRFERLAEVGDFLFHQQAGDGGLEEMGDAFGGCVGAVRGAECVVDVDLGERGQRLGEGRIVGFFFGVVAQVFEQQHLAATRAGGRARWRFRRRSRARRRR